MPRYDSIILDSGQYTPQYAGIPLEEIQKTGDVLAERHYSNLANLSQLKLLAEKEKSQLLPGAKSYVDEHINQIDEALSELARSGAENATARVQAMANTYLGDQGRLLALAQSEARGKERAAYEADKAKGLNPVYNKKAAEALESASVYITDEEGNKVLNPLYVNPYTSSVQPYVEAAPVIDELIKPIKPDVIEGRLGAPAYLSLQALMPQVMQGGVPNVQMFYEMLKTTSNKDKILGFIDELQNQVKNTSLGKQVDELAGVDNVMTPERLKETVTERALMHIYNQLDRTVMQNNLGDDVLKGAGNDATRPGGEESMGVLPTKTVKREDLDFTEPKAPDLTTNPQYTISGSRQAVQNKNTGAGYTNNPDWKTKAEQKYKEDKEIFEAKKAKLKEEAMVAADVLNLDDKIDVSTPEGLEKAKDVVRKYRDWTDKRMENQAIFKKGYKTSADYNMDRDDVIRNLSQRKIYGITEGVNNTFLDEDKTIREDFQDLASANKEDIYYLGTVNPLGPYGRIAGPEYASANVIELRNKEGEVKQYLVTKSDGELKTPASQRDEIKNQIYTETSIRPGYEVEIPLTIYNGQERAPLGTVKVQEHIGKQRQKVIGMLSEEEQKKALMAPRIYTIKRPGSDDTEVYFDVSEIAQSIIPE